VPMLKETEVIGSITIYRQEVQPFSDKQIALVRSFASQAIIAIENTRLLHELRQRTDDLGEALEQQTATSEVLKVISSSPGELNLVFNIMLAKATELCEASYGTLWLRDGDGYRAAAIHGDLPTLFVEQWRGTLYRPDPEVTLARSVRARKPIQEADVRTTPQYLIGDPLPVTAVDIAGIRTLMVVPMLKDNEPIGGIAIYRKEVRPFGEKQIELVTNFAAQAVIAIENARLLNELRESLQQQTATADVLSVISSSAGELEPVFSTMLENATRICEAKFGVLLLCDSGGFRTVALHNAPPAFAEERRRNPLIHPAPGTGLRRLADTKQVAQVADMKALKPYIDGDPFVVNSVDLGGYRTVINVPMLKENSLVGAISIYRQEVRPFTDKQIELVQNFANQAVIAIENARLLNELRESLQQQTATADVLKVISSSPGNLGAVFQAMLENAVHICEAKFGVTNLHENGVLRMGAMHNVPSAFAEFLQERVTYEPLPGSLLARVVQTKQVCHVVPPNLSAEQQPSAARALPSAYQW
jgi:GAF domain-containing protein